MRFGVPNQHAKITLILRSEMNMTDIIGILDAMYSDKMNPAAVLDSSGRAVWQNTAAEKYFNADPAALADIASELAVRSESSGRISAIADTGFKRLDIASRSYWLVEISNCDSVAELFKNLYISRHLRRGDARLRQEIACISASCEAIGASLPEEINESAEEIREYLTEVMSSCARLLRSSSLELLLTASSFEDRSALPAISADEFIDELAAGISAVPGARFTVTTVKSSGALIKADRLTLTYYILMLIHSFISGSGAPLMLGCELRNGKVYITAETGDFHQKTQNNTDAEFDEFFIRTAAERLGSEFELSSGRLVISFPEAEAPVGDCLESSRVTFDDGYFSPYNLILASDDDYQAYF